MQSEHWSLGQTWGPFFLRPSPAFSAWLPEFGGGRDIVNKWRAQKEHCGRLLSVYKSHPLTSVTFGPVVKDFMA